MEAVDEERVEGGVDKLDSVQELEGKQGEALNALVEFRCNSREDVSGTIRVADVTAKVTEMGDRVDLCASV